MPDANGERRARGFHGPTTAAGRAAAGSGGRSHQRGRGSLVELPPRFLNRIPQAVPRTLLSLARAGMLSGSRRIRRASAKAVAPRKNQATFDRAALPERFAVRSALRRIAERSPERFLPKRELSCVEELVFGISFGVRARITRGALHQGLVHHTAAFTLGFRRGRSPLTNVGDGCPGGAIAVLRVSSERGKRMTSPSITTLETVSLEESLAYLDCAEGDELAAAHALAMDRNRLDGSTKEPDDAEVHHALFLLRRARGLAAPSFDLMRVQRKRRAA